MNILIIGGTGILSTAVVNSCVEKGYSVTMINRGHRSYLMHPKAKLIKCDVRDVSQLEDITNKICDQTYDAVIDFLVFTTPQLEISLHYFSAIAKQYIFISSAQVYNTSLNGVLTEDSPKPQKLWSYSVNKLACEEFLVNYCNANNRIYTIIRPAVNYDGTRIPYGICPPMGYHWTFVERILNDKPIITWNGGSNRLNLTRVEDFAEGTVGLIGNSAAYNEAFNVAGDNIYSWGEVLKELGRLVGKQPIVFDLPVDYYAGELKGIQKEELLGGRANDMICSTEKLRKVLPHYRANYSLDSGLKLTLEYYKKNSFLYGVDYGFDGECDRIIRKYCRQHNMTIPKQCKFINYSNHDRVRNTRSYYMPFIREMWIYRFLRNILKK